MRSRFDEQLHELNVTLVTMGERIVCSIKDAIEALEKKDVEKAKVIMNEDEKVDQLQKKIENICFQLLIQQQPVAKDLRLVTAAMKMVTDMERIGDHAADISEITVLMGQKSRINQFDHFVKMAAETMVMLNQSIESFVTKNKELALSVIAHDDIVDDLFNEAKNDIVNLIRDNKTEGEEAVDLLMVAKYFERIGDHATNIAEWVLYSLKTQEGD